MTLLERIFGRRKEAQQQEVFFKLLSGYTSAHYSHAGGMYEMALIRAAIHSFASFCGKLEPVEQGGDKYSELLKNPNELVGGTYNFLYRIATILAIHNTAFIVPEIDDRGTVRALYPILPTEAKVVRYEDAAKPYLRFRFMDGRSGALELNKVGIMTRHQYKSDVFGESADALSATLDMMAAQDSAITQAARDSRSLRFLAKLMGPLKSSDSEKLQSEFYDLNLRNNKTGVAVFDGKYQQVEVINVKPYTPEEAQIELINRNVCTYFGTSLDILQNKYDENTWGAYYEGQIEPFALQLSQALSRILYSEDERRHGMCLMFTANRLQYAHNRTKLDVCAQLLDRGIISRNEAREVFNLPHVEDGDKYYIRKDYAEISELGKEQKEELHGENNIP